jgi:hypothetical protein
MFPIRNKAFLALYLLLVEKISNKQIKESQIAYACLLCSFVNSTPDLVREHYREKKHDECKYIHHCCSNTKCFLIKLLIVNCIVHASDASEQEADTHIAKKVKAERSLTVDTFGEGTSVSANDDWAFTSRADSQWLVGTENVSAKFHQFQLKAAELGNERSLNYEEYVEELL